MTAPAIGKVVKDFVRPATGDQTISLSGAVVGSGTGLTAVIFPQSSVSLVIRS